LDALRSSLVFLLLATLQPLAAPAQSPWLSDPAVQQRLAAGEVVVATVTASDSGHPRGHIHAAVRIRATPEAIWRVMTDCQQAPRYVPGLKRCRLIDGAPDGSWQDIEHEVRYSWLLPTIRYVFRAQYDRPHRIDFHRISGDLKEEEGTWLLSATADGSATVVDSSDTRRPLAAPRPASGPYGVARPRGKRANRARFALAAQTPRP
jgi:uncharacterized protein YndB with AHSA1/START domain